MPDLKQTPLSVPTPPPLDPPGDAGTAANTAVTRRDRVGVRVAWVVILVCVGGIAASTYRAESRRERARQAAAQPPDAQPPAATTASGHNRGPGTDAAKGDHPLPGTPGTHANRGQDADDAADSHTADAGQAVEPLPAQVRMLARYAVGANRMFPGSGIALADAVRTAASTPGERLAVVPVVAELAGREAALADLAKLPAAALRTPAGDPTPLGRDAEALRAVYALPSNAAGPASRPADGRPAADGAGEPATAPTIDTADVAAARERLRGRLGWAGRLAASSAAGDTDPGRRAVLKQASLTFFMAFGVMGVAVIGLIAGLGLLIWAG
ncbi:MAG: hypothetical protein JWO31_3197, partial [Phycisphaerales bacterium]|nr:hypothetical protein [Phycisphaerales bacterium]